MIRKKREITQVDLFGEWTQTASFENASENRVVRIRKIERNHPVTDHSTRNDGLRVKQESESTELILFDDLLPKDGAERMDRKNEQQGEIKNEATLLNTKIDDDNLINKDFADGFDAFTNEGEREPSVALASRENRRRRILKIGITVFLFALAILIFNWNEWIVQSPMFALKYIEVHGEDLIRREEIIEWSGLKIGTRLGSLDVSAIEEQLKQKPYFNEVNIHKRYPSTLVIRVNERRPIALIVMDELYPMDENGFVLPKLKAVRSYNLPLITGLRTALKTGMELRSAEIQPMRRFLSLARDRYPVLYFEISEVEYTKHALRIYMNHFSFPLLIDPDAIERSLLALETASDYLKKNNPGHAVREVDLRYEQKMIIRDK